MNRQTNKFHCDLRHPTKKGMTMLTNKELTIDLDTLKEHIKHELVFTTFGTDGDVWNYTLACKDCQAVIADLDVDADGNPIEEDE